MWTRFGLNVLENTLESCNLKSHCKTTQDLDKLLRFVEDYLALFTEFVFKDSEEFELKANPRTINLDIEHQMLCYELSNLENLVLIRIRLKLNAMFPLRAVETRIENLIGTINNNELINMISAISPNGCYLTHVAECIEDFLKFLPVKSGCGVLDITRT